MARRSLVLQTDKPMSIIAMSVQIVRILLKEGVIPREQAKINNAIFRTSRALVYAETLDWSDKNNGGALLQYLEKNTSFVREKNLINEAVRDYSSWYCGRNQAMAGEEKGINLKADAINKALNIITTISFICLIALLSYHICDRPMPLNLICRCTLCTSLIIVAILVPISYKITPIQRKTEPDKRTPF